MVLGELELDDLAEPHPLDIVEPERAERPAHRLALRVEHGRLQGDDDAGFHGGGNYAPHGRNSSGTGARLCLGRWPYYAACVFELAVACAALIGRALLQAADAAVLAVGEAEARAVAAGPSAPISARPLADLKAHPQPTAAALRGASPLLVALAALARA